MDPLEVRRTRPAQTNIKNPVRETASQTAGPYVHIGCVPNWLGIGEAFSEDITRNTGQRQKNGIVISGHVYEGEKIPCKDVMLEFWQADSVGDYNNGIWHRVPTDLETGQYSIETVMPGTFDDGKGRTLSPFINVWVVARGINIGLLTRIYFPDHFEAHSTDPHLALVPESRQQTLIAHKGNNPGEYLFDIHLQGDSETIFFET